MKRYRGRARTEESAVGNVWEFGGKKMMMDTFCHFASVRCFGISSSNTQFHLFI